MANLQAQFKKASKHTDPNTMLSWGQYTVPAWYWVFAKLGGANPEFGLGPNPRSNDRDWYVKMRSFQRQMARAIAAGNKEYKEVLSAVNAENKRMEKSLSKMDKHIKSLVEELASSVSLLTDAPGYKVAREVRWTLNKYGMDKVSAPVLDWKVVQKAVDYYASEDSKRK